MYFLSMLCESVLVSILHGPFLRVTANCKCPERCVWLPSAAAAAAAGGGVCWQIFCMRAAGGRLLEPGSGAWDGNMGACPRILGWPWPGCPGEAAAVIKTVIRCWGRRLGSTDLLVIVIIGYPPPSPPARRHNFFISIWNNEWQMENFM